MGGTQVTSCSRRWLDDDLQQSLLWMPGDPSISPEMEDGLFGTEQIPSQQPGSLPALGVGGFEGLSHDSQLFRLLGGGHPCLHLRHHLVPSCWLSQQSPLSKAVAADSTLV